MAHAQKPDFIFRRNGRVHLNRRGLQSTAGSRGVRISGSNAGYTTFRSSVRVLATHSIRQFPLHFPSCASPCAIRFQTSSTSTDCRLKTADAPGSERLPVSLHELSVYYLTRETVNPTIAT